jgi:hypothetical protein
MINSITEPSWQVQDVILNKTDVNGPRELKGGGKTLKIAPNAAIFCHLSTSASVHALIKF